MPDAVRGQRAADVRAGEVVALVGGNHEQGVRRVDPVVREPLEERRERGVVGGEVRLVAGVARSLGRAAVRAARLTGLPLVRVRDVAVGDRHADLLHVGHVRERLRGADRAEPREARRVRRQERAVDLVAVQVDEVPGGVHDRVGVAVDDAVSAGVGRLRELRLQVLLAEHRVEVVSSHPARPAARRRRPSARVSSART